MDDEAMRKLREKALLSLNGHPAVQKEVKVAEEVVVEPPVDHITDNTPDKEEGEIVVDYPNTEDSTEDTEDKREDREDRERREDREDKDRDKNTYKRNRGGSSNRRFDNRRRKGPNNRSRGNYSSSSGFNGGRNNDYDPRYSPHYNGNGSPPNGSQNMPVMGMMPPNPNMMPPNPNMMPLDFTTISPNPMQPGIMPMNMDLNLISQSLAANPALAQTLWTLFKGQPAPGYQHQQTFQNTQPNNSGIKRKRSDEPSPKPKKKFISKEELDRLKREHEKHKEQHASDLYYLENISKKLGKVESDIGQIEILKHSMATKIRILEENLRVAKNENQQVSQEMHFLKEKKKKLLEDRNQTEQKLKSLEPLLEEGSSNLMRLEIRFNIDKKAPPKN